MKTLSPLRLFEAEFSAGFADSSGQFFTFIVTVVLVAHAGESLGLVGERAVVRLCFPCCCSVGALVPNRMLSIILAPLAIAPFILFTPYGIPSVRNFAGCLPLNQLACGRVKCQCSWFG